MKILVTGANGQVGWELARIGPQWGLDVSALDRTALDITDRDTVRNVIRQLNASVVVNTAGYTAVDQAETESALAFAANRDGPAYLAAACAAAGIPLVHISTDYVFDGTQKTPYVETDPVAPLGIYGQSKAAGENEVRARLHDHIILRTAWVYGVHGQNFVKTMLRLGREQEEIRVVADQFGCPTAAADLAEAIVKIVIQIRDSRNIAWGTYHYCGAGVTTWHGFSLTIFELARQYVALKVKSIKPIRTHEYATAAKRPGYAVLDCSLIRRNFDIEPRPWKASLAEMISRMGSAADGSLV